MNFALCTDNNYAIPCLVSIISIFENNKGEVCDVYVLTSNLKQEKILLYKKISKIYNQRILIIDVDITTYSNLKNRGRYPKTMYYRFLLPELLKSEETVLYLDCDIIVRRPLKDLFKYNLEGYSCAAVEDQEGDDIRLRNINRYLGRYFNSGVLLMNLKYWRQNNVTNKLVTFIEDNPERCHFPDQDALNIVLENTVLFLPYNYNFQEQWYKNLNRLSILFTKHQEIIDARKGPVLIHYTNGFKPWHYECEHPHQEWFSEYANLYPWIGFKMSHKISFSNRMRIRITKAIRHILDVVFPYRINA